MFIGRLGTLTTHRHPIAVCVVALRAPLRVSIDRGAESRVCRSIIIPARLPHSLDADGEPVAVLYNDPDRPYYRRLSLLHESGIGALNPGTEASVIDAIREIHDLHLAGAKPSFDAFEAAAEQALGIELEPRPVDERVKQVLTLIRADLDRNHSIAELAAQVGLSAGRLQHLFAEEIGLPLRAFRLWVRLRQAAEQVAGGNTVTAAALDAGFSNSSHFSHAFRATFGIAAVSAFRNARIRLQLCASPGD